MNSWNIIEKGNRKVPSNIYPIYLSYHISNIKNIDSITLNNLKKNEPIGCRDKFTQKYLQKKGINSYFSSCLTTTLDINFAVNQIERTNDIIFVDFRFGEFPKADKFIKSLKAYNFSNIKYKRHMIKSQYSHLQRFKIAKQLLDQYARAKLVISTRIHGALPCLALKTPIIFVNKKYDIRYPGLYELLNTVGINSKGKFEINVKLNNNNYVVNPTNYLQYAHRLKIRLKNLSLNI
jgi:polysaccharide pyruvyl transferase WcaK-like protein